MQFDQNLISTVWIGIEVFFFVCQTDYDDILAYSASTQSDQSPPMATIGDDLRFLHLPDGLADMLADLWLNWEHIPEDYYPWRGTFTVTPPGMGKKKNIAPHTPTHFGPPSTSS